MRAINEVGSSRSPWLKEDSKQGVWMLLAMMRLVVKTLIDDLPLPSPKDPPRVEERVGFSNLYSIGKGGESGLPNLHGSVRTIGERYEHC
ncbi:hypothetical protein GW17_00040386 [Ensete ventricosum]|nr:hypothetical protein GW17_00040386 [Ensete ventricosum]